MTTNLDLMFDHDLCVGVASNLVREHHLSAEAEEYEIGMSQVRLDPADRTVEHGFIACPGQNADGTPTWVLLRTTRTTTPGDDLVYYDTIEGDYGTDLSLDLNSPIDAVAATIAAHITAADPRA